MIDGAAPPIRLPQRTQVGLAVQPVTQSRPFRGTGTAGPKPLLAANTGRIANVIAITGIVRAPSVGGSRTALSAARSFDGPK
ncbi:MAG: hypothetical protein D6725_14950 [Planctomycetota bacterium]|nr:MAG: hypothetical protein D6725_14950 [Planctomycetota bacterium]